MARRLRSVDLDFIESAPLRLVFAAEVSAPPEVVYRALADDVAGWPSWFTSVTAARPTEDGAGREVRLRGGTVLRESILAAKPCERYTYRVDESSTPGPKALLEEWRLTPAGAGTRVQWTFAADGSATFRFALRLGRPGMGRAFRDAVRNLDRRLAGSGA
ncbi:MULTISPECIES: SRPBCC family protein [unclassified Streptomyces]|uniref:SRPBCC family protein n=1 Tax=unclassified Streptomyces TaxID=2593676 RepID=UPI0033FD1865